MGCTNCGGGTPNGCKNNGTCSSGGCNKLEVYNWLANMSLPGGQAPYDILEIRFKNSRKGFYRNTKNLSLQLGDVVILFPFLSILIFYTPKLWEGILTSSISN